MSVGVQLRAVKTAAENRNLNAIPFADATLQLAVAANMTYIFEMIFFATAGNGAGQDIKWNFSTPTLTRGFYNAIHHTSRNPSTTIQSASQLVNTPIAFTTNYSTSGLSTNTFVHRLTGMFTVGGSGGTFIFNWAQTTSTATNTTLNVGAYLLLTEAA